MNAESPRPAGCARVRARLPVLLDGGLAPLEAALDRGHLEVCTQCQRERAHQARLLADIRAASAPPAHEVELAVAAVRARLSALRPARARAGWRSSETLAAAAAAVLLVVLLATRGAGPVPHGIDLATFERILEELPSWSEVVRGLGSLSRWIS